MAAHSLSWCFCCFCCLLRLGIDYRLIAPSAGAAGAAAEAADVLALGVGELELAALDLLREGGVTQLGILGHALLHGVAGGAAEHAHTDEVAAGVGAVGGAGGAGEGEVLGVVGGAGGHGGGEDTEVGDLHGRAVEHQFADAGGDLREHAEDHVLGVGRPVLCDVLGQALDVDGLVVLRAGIHLAEVLVSLDLVLVEIQFDHGVE